MKVRFTKRGASEYSYLYKGEGLLTQKQMFTVIFHEVPTVKGASYFGRYYLIEWPKNSSISSPYNSDKDVDTGDMIRPYINPSYLKDGQMNWGKVTNALWVDAEALEVCDVQSNEEALYLLNDNGGGEFDD